MLLTVSSLNLSYGPRTLFRDASFIIQPHARTGLVGPNGSGKTTLLRIINGIEEPDQVSMESASGLSAGYLPQEGVVLGKSAVIDEVEAAASDIQDLNQHLKAAEMEMQSLPEASEDYLDAMERFSHLTTRLQDLEAHKLRPKAEKILFGLGFRERDLQRFCGEFSGGWQMRIALAKLLLQEPDLLMMDEPTNHLDLDSLRWLEGFLTDYPGAILVISHDQALLDKLCTSILSIEQGRLFAYTGNYRSFLEQRDARQAQLETARKSQERKIAQTERFIERFRYKATKARQVQSRIKALEKMELVETETKDKHIQFAFPLSRKGGQKVFNVESLCKSYSENTVFRNFSISIERGDRIGVVGLNGAGKSTLARLLACRESADSGKLEPGYQVDIGYFAQDQTEDLDPALTVLQAASRPPVRGPEVHVRNILGAFLFSGDDIDKRVSVLSGGEKNRLALARLLLCPANFLILDEPTNHLDIASKAVLQEALKSFPGTTFIVSHDRQFLNPVVNRILEIQPARARVFPGNLDDYLWKIDQEREKSAVPSSPSSEDRATSENPKARRQRQARQKEALAPLRKELDQLEKEVASLEERIQKRETEMADKAFFEQGETTAAFLREYDHWKTSLAEKMEKWEQVAASLAEKEREMDA